MAKIDLYSPRAIKSLLKIYSSRPNKILGQNFIASKEIVEKIIKTADLQPNDTVLEIGPGIGTLTLELAKRAKRVIAVEKDKKMCSILQDFVQKRGLKNVEIINNDILKLQNTNNKLLLNKFGVPNEVEGQTKHKTQITKSQTKTYKLTNLKTYKLVANIPYYITQPIIRMFLESENPPKEIILLVQKEVAQRICNKKKMSLLAVSVQFYAEPEIIDYISKSSFWPEPKVDSAILRIKCRVYETLHKANRDKFFKVVRAGFSAPRKMLINNLSKKLKIPREQIVTLFNKIGLSEKARAENLSVEEWAKLSTSNF